jgi:hypothetical protein
LDDRGGNLINTRVFSLEAPVIFTMASPALKLAADVRYAPWAG